MNFTESPDHAPPRSTVSAVAADVGHTYDADLTRQRGKTDARWDVMSERPESH
jgi:hypothetical protein